MNNTRQHSGYIALAPLGGLIGAVIGGVLWAKMSSGKFPYIQWTGFTAGCVALAVGTLAGFGVLLTGRSRKISVSLVASLFAIISILFGKYLDVRWNALPEITVGIIDAHKDIPPDYAESIAKTVEASESGGSTWKLMRRRMAWVDLIFYIGATYIAFRIVHSKSLHRFFFRTES
ncbi:hypothetical protein HYR99_23070 [Candidatus Poribacteria bacterium]|nr:hypothetical protein [Candidatus Poribacteria bacterium]